MASCLSIFAINTVLRLSYLIHETNTCNSLLYLHKSLCANKYYFSLFLICLNKYQQYCMISKVEHTIDHIVSQIAKIEKESKQLVTGKDIFMFIGFTGVGKSTLINLLLNKKLYCKDKGLILPDSQAQLQGPKIASNPTVSQTRDISIWNNQSSLLMCDTPGFGDTGGYEIDIYNCSYITGVVKHANNLKVILVLSESELTEPKYTKLRKLIKKISKAFTTFNTNNLQVCITKTLRFDDQVEIHNEFKKILDKGQDQTQKQAQMLKFLASSCKIHLFPFEKKVGVQILIEPGTKDQILKMDNSIKNIYAGQHFNFISQQSKISIHQLIQTLQDQKIIFNKDKQIAYSSLKDVKKLLDELYQGKASAQEVLQKIEVEGTENGIKISVSGITYIIGVQVARYAVTFALLVIGEAAIGAAALGRAGYVLAILGGSIGMCVAVGVTAIGFLAKFIYSKYQNKKKATNHIENVIKTIKNVIEADQLLIKKIDQIQVNLKSFIK